MTNKYMKMLLSVQIKCTDELLKIEEEDELVSVLHACIETWAKKTGYDTLEIMNMLVSDEKMVQEEIERNRQKQLQKETKLLYNEWWKGGEPDERKDS